MKAFKLCIAFLGLLLLGAAWPWAQPGSSGSAAIPGYSGGMGNDATIQYLIALSRAQALEHLPRFYFSADTTAGCVGDMPQGDDATGDGTMQKPWRSFGRMRPLFLRGAAVIVLDVCDTWETNDGGAAGDNESTGFLLANENLRASTSDWTYCSNPRQVCVAIIGSDPSGSRRATVRSVMLDAGGSEAGSGFLVVDQDPRKGWLHVGNINFLGATDGTSGWPGTCATASDFYRTDSFGQLTMLNVTVEMCATGATLNEVWTSHNSSTGEFNVDYFVGINVGCRYLEVAGTSSSAPCHLNAGGSAVALIGGFSTIDQVNSTSDSQFALGLVNGGSTAIYNYGYVNSHRVWFNTTDTTSAKFGFSSINGANDTSFMRMFVANTSVINAGTGATNGFWRAAPGGVAGDSKNNEYAGYRNVSFNNDWYIDASGGWAAGEEWLFWDRCSIQYAGASGGNTFILQNGGGSDCAAIDMDVLEFRIEEASALVSSIEATTFGTITSGATGFCDDAPSLRGCHGGAWTACGMTDLTTDPTVNGGLAAGLCMTADCNAECPVGPVTERFRLGLYIPSYLVGAEIVGFVHGAAVTPIGR